MMRQRHFRALIGPLERDGWLICFRRAFDETLRHLHDPVVQKIDARNASFWAARRSTTPES